MQLSLELLTSRCQVLARVASPPDVLRQVTYSWQPQGEPVPCASFPAGERILRRAQLLSIKVSREVYLQGIDLNPAGHRLVVDGITYSITDVQEWPGFTVAACVGV